MIPLRSYHYGQDNLPDTLLAIQDSVEKGTALQKQQLVQAGEQTVALREYSGRMDQIHETLQGGLEEMRSEFQWGFTLMVDRMEDQIGLLKELAAKLDAIHSTLKSPLMTQARELFDVGQNRLQKGLYDKALEGFLQLEWKNERNN